MALQRDKVTASAEKLVARGRIDQAIKEYERLLEENPNDVNTLNRIGDLWVRIDKPDEAVKVFRKIADHYSHDGFFLKAIAIYKKINKLDPAKLDIYAKLAELYAKQGLAMEAKSQYMVLADYYLKHADVASAITIYLKIADLDPHAVNVHIRLADLYSQNQQPAEALSEYDRVGRMLLKRGMTTEAMQVFRKALKIDAGNVDLAESLVGALVEEKDFENAILVLQAALESNKENPRLIALIARTQLMKGDSAAARATLEKGLQSNPSDLVIRESLAEAYLRDGMTSRALDLIQPLIAVAGERAEGRLAVEVLRRILKAEPYNIDALEKLVTAYDRLQDLPNENSARAQLAAAHLQRSDYLSAETLLRDLMVREPANVEHREKLAFVLQRTGRPTQPEAEPVAASGDEFLLPEDDFGFHPIEQGEPSPAAPPPPPEPVVEEIASAEEPLEEFEFDLEIEEPPVLEEVPIAAVPEPNPAASAEVEIPASVSFEDLEEERAQDVEALEFANEHVTEADVFAKYGLIDKAIDHLRAAIGRLPDHAPAYEKLLTLYINDGNRAAASTTAEAFVSVLRQLGDFQKAEEVEGDLIARGLLRSPDSSASSAAAIVEVEEEADSTDFEPLDIPEIVLESPVEFAESAASPDREASLGSATEPDQPASAGDVIDEEYEIDFDQFGDLPLAAETIVEPLPVEPLEEELLPEGTGAVETPLEEQLAGEQEPVRGEAISAEELLAGEPELVRDEALPAEEQFAADQIAEEQLFEDSTEEAAVPGEFPQDMPASPAGATVDEFFGEAPSFGSLEGGGGAFAESTAQEPVEEEFVPSLPGGDLFFGFADDEPLTAIGPTVEEIGELDFYIEQELFDEAENKLRTLSGQYPGNPALETRAVRLRALREGAAPHELSLGEPVAQPAMTLRDLMGAAPPAESYPAESYPAESYPAESYPESPPIIVPPPVVEEEEDLFSAEDDFFDLASELERELAEDVVDQAAADEEQSLEQIFREFKKGVEQQLDSEDYDTHYNLGIAYKEMGLIDEAIGEFQLASKDPKRAIDGCSMLGLCFLEKGMPQLAVKWYGKGLENPEISEDEHLGLLYDLGNAYLEMGDMDQAHKAFIEVYGINSKYRDVVTRIKQLEEVRRIQ